jgi:hypothetical protein
MIAAERHSSDIAPEDPSKPQLIIGIDADNAVIRGVDGVLNTLVAGSGTNQLLIGAGPQTDFVFDTMNAHDRVSGFRPGVDHIVFDHQPFGVAEQNIVIGPIPASAGPAGAVVHLGDASIMLIGVEARSLSDADFIINVG